MTLKDQIDLDLKSALLAGEKLRVETLRSLKSAILYAEVDKGVKGVGLGEQEIIDVLVKEGKKRQDSADLYAKAGAKSRVEQELEEKAIIGAYLPEAMSENKILELINQAIEEVGSDDSRSMGQIIDLVKSRANNAADGGTIARLTKEKLRK